MKGYIYIGNGIYINIDHITSLTAYSTYSVITLTDGKQYRCGYIDNVEKAINKERERLKETNKMKGFIKLTYHGEELLINVNAIQGVSRYGDGAIITFIDDNSKENVIDESYDSIKAKIKEAMK